MFAYCNCLDSLPDISKWNTNNVTNMNGMFKNCYALSSLLDISVWNTNNVIDMSDMFENCSKLSSLPDIMLLKCVKCLLFVQNYHLFLIFQNGILKMLII